MECTQRLEYTQDVYETFSQRTCPEQIGFLGICGVKHAIKKGPNKIGRDPQTCSIVLDAISISRQHAVINVLNKKNFMLMDLDSANKTMLLGKTLQPYIPHSLNNGDTIQFGKELGIFRLLEEDDDLPMTQAVDIPDTPVNDRHVSRLKNVPITTIPESPDISDRDDSVIAQSQTSKKIKFKSPNTGIIKKSGKTIGIQPVGTNKIDNVYWNSSKKSDSFSNLFEEDSNNIVNKISISPKKLSMNHNNIFDLETQPPNGNKTSDSIYDAITQLSPVRVSPNIYNCETQMPNIEKLPEVCKVQDQNDNMQLNLYSSKKKNVSIFEAETQISLPNKENQLTPSLSCAKTSRSQKHEAACSITNQKLNTSDEEICFEEIDSQPFDDECGSQPLLPPAIEDEIPIVNKETRNVIDNEKSKVSFVLEDSDSKDSEEIAPSQMVTEKPIADEDVTDCEDNMIELDLTNARKPNKNQSDEDVTDCEDDIIEISQNKSNSSNSFQNNNRGNEFENLPTQVIGEDLLNHDREKKCLSDEVVVPFEDMLTQVIEECPIDGNVNPPSEKDTCNQLPLEDLQTQVIDIVDSQEQPKSSLVGNNDSFKIPVSSPKLKKKDVKPVNKSISTTLILKETNQENKGGDDHNYYDATQQILNDLCSQNESNKNRTKSSNESKSGDSESNDNIKKSIMSLSKDNIIEIIGADIVPLSKKKSSDSSDLEVTPKKFNPSKFLLIDLPNSQEIKSCNFVSSKIDLSDCSDGFEDTEEQEDIKDRSPGLHRKRRKKDVKVDLMKKFDSTTLPTRAMTRIRKPTSKILNGDETSKKMCEKILQSKLGLDNTHEIDSEILQINLKRLRNKMERAKQTSEKQEKDVEVDPIKKEQNLRKSDNSKSKKQNLPQSNEKELKQQSIKSMLKDNKPEEKKMAADSDVKVELQESSNVKPRISRKKKEEDNNEIKDSALEQGKSATRVSRRSGRTHSHSKRGKQGDKNEKIKSGVDEMASENHDSKHKSTHKKQVKETIDLTEETEPTVRRSKRQANKDTVKKESSRNSRESKQTNKSDERHSGSSKKSNNFPNDEQSAIYNLSSETGASPPTVLKRQATSDIFPPKSKKSKSGSVSTSVRATPVRGVRTQYVLFTAFPSEEVKVKLEKLGAVIVSDVKACTVLLTLQVRRTFKLLCAVGLGKPIVGPNWVQACADSNMIVDPWLYLMKDEATEKRFNFNLRQSLTCKRNYLKGCNVSCTPGVTPSGPEMKSIVECSGGTWKEAGPNWYCVSCTGDKALWAGLRRRGAIIVSTEFVLGGVLQQRMNLERDRLA